MQDENEIRENTTVEAEPSLTPIAAEAGAGALLREFAGVQTPAQFAGMASEVAALTASCGVYDLGWLARLWMTGEDRVRWLNGMVTNTVKDLKSGHLNYTFLLNAQGRIQGDGEVYALDDSLLLITDRVQAHTLAQHLERFIIMDEVELVTDHAAAALGLAGPHAESLLASLGLIADAGTGAMAANTLSSSAAALAAKDDAGHFTVWVEPAHLVELWSRIVAAGAVPCGMDAVEALRVLEGRPRYGVDITDKTLAQETGQMRALHFSKGCYLGQEIVERVRSRATVHRGIYCLALEGDAPVPGASLFAEGSAGSDAAVGTLTSIAVIHGPGLPKALCGTFALATVRTEAAVGPSRYAGGIARVLERPPALTASTPG